VETLKTFCDLVETGSLSRAARLNLVSQSAVSQQLRALEGRYSCRLIERAPRIGARATEAGRLLYEEVKPFLERLGALEQRLRARPDVVAGTVRVATVYSVGLHTLPPTIKRCLADHPEVNVRLSYRRTNEVYAACLDGDVDFGIVAVPTRRPQLEIVPLGHDELVIAAPPTHSIARRARCPLAALDGQPFIGFDRDIPTRRLIDRLLRRHGVRVNYTMELDNIETIKRSVEAGLGLSLLPAPTLVAEIRARTLVARSPLEGPFRRPIGVIYRRTRELSGAGRAFLALLQAELGARVAQVRVNSRNGGGPVNAPAARRG
jgi:DNA-binding transcriptional LysR family regulator